MKGEGTAAGKRSEAFSLPLLLAVLLAGALAGAGLSALFELKLSLWALPMAALALLALTAFLCRGRRKGQEQEFQALIRYMEQLIYLFRRTPRFASCLRQLEPILGEPMKTLADQGADALDRGPDFGRKWLEELERRYPVNCLRELHRFFLKIEEEGGEYAGGLDQLLLELRWFSRQEELYQQELGQLRGRLELCFLLSIGMGLGTARMIPDSLGVRALPLYQLGSLLLLLGCSLGALITELSFSGPWGRSAPPLSRERVEQLRGRLKGREKPGPYLLRLGGSLALLILCARGGYGAAGVPAGFLFLWQLLEPLRQKRQARRLLAEEALRQLPAWLEELAVHLQTQTVQTALAELSDTAVPLLRSYLTELRHELEEDPISMEPYRHFMTELELPRVREAMVLLYSLHGTGRHHAAEQLEALVEKNRELYLRGEELRRRDSTMLLNQLAFIPMSFTVLKLMADLLLTLMAFLRAL